MAKFFLSVWLAGSVFLLFPLADFRVFTDLPLYVAEIPLIVLVTMLIFRWFLSGESYCWTKKDRWMSLGMFLFLCGSFIAFVVNKLPPHSLGLIKSFVLLPILLAFGLRHTLLSLGDHSKLLSLWYGGVVAGAIAAVASFYLGGLTYDNRLVAWYDSPNQLAFLLGPGILMGIYFFIISSKEQLILRLGIACSLLGILLPLFLTRSYGVIFSLAIAGIFLLLTIKGRHIIFRLFPFVVLAVTVWVGAEYSTDKFQSLVTFDERSSLSSRMTIWTVAMLAARESFPWGIGIGQFQIVYLAYQAQFPPYLEWAVPEPHNLFLSLYLSSGLVGLLGVCISLYHGVVGVQSVLKQEKYRTLALTYVSLLFYWLLVGLLDTPYFDNALALGFWGVLGALWTLQSLPQEEKE